MDFLGGLAARAAAYSTDEAAITRLRSVEDAVAGLTARGQVISVTAVKLALDPGRVQRRRLKRPATLERLGHRKWASRLRRCRRLALTLTDVRVDVAVDFNAAPVGGCIARKRIGGRARKH